MYKRQLLEDSIDLRGGPLISLILSRDDKHFYDGPHTKRTVPAKGGNFLIHIHLVRKKSPNPAVKLQCECSECKLQNLSDQSFKFFINERGLFFFLAYIYFATFSDSTNSARFVTEFIYLRK